MYQLPIPRIYVWLFTLLAGVLLFPSCDKEESTPDTPTTYKLTLTKSTRGKITQDPNQATFKSGEKVTLTPVPNESYEFAGWMGDDVPKGEEKANPLTLTMDGDKMIAATFAQKMETPTYKLTLTPPKHGKVEGHKATYAKDAMTEITAKADEGYAFSHWTGVSDGDKEDNPLEVVMTKDLTLGAVFVKTHKFTLTPTTHGTVNQSPDQAIFDHGGRVSLTAMPNSGYAFSHWTGLAYPHNSNNPLTVTLTSDTTVGVVFVKTYDLTLTTPTHGSVTKDPDQTTFKSGETVTLTASPADATYEFTGWTGAPSGKENTNPLTLTMDGAKTIAATFAKKTYTLTVNATNGSVAKSVTQPKYNHGDSVTLTATANKDYGFNGWSGHNIPKGYEKANPLTIGVTSNTTITAHFQMPIYLAANGKTLKAAGFTKGGEKYTYKGTEYTIAAGKAALEKALADGEDMSKYITTKVTDMSGMFRSESTFNDDISAWDVSNVTDMSSMFSRASVFNQDISSWDVSKVRSMFYMFYRASAFNQNISAWDVSAATTMEAMFEKANKFNQDLSGWCVQQFKNKPTDFDISASAWTNANHKPVWGDASKCTN